MNRMLWSAVSVLALAVTATPQDSPSRNARQIMEEVQRRQKTDSQHYEGSLEVIGAGNRIASKRWIFERVGSSGMSKGILRFTAPAEVKGVALLIVNHADRASDQWIWRPAIGREQRIALQDRSTRFFGTDFSFEDLEERDVDQYDFQLEDENNSAWKIQATPRKSSQYTRSSFWVAKDRMVVVKAELYNKKGLARTIDYRDFAQVKSIWAALTTEVHDLLRDSRTILKYDKLDFNIPLRESDFTVDALRRTS